MSQEIELKLAIDPRDVQTLRESSILRELRLKHTPLRSLVSVYYDTPGHCLARRGIILRVRKIGSERLQCVKMNAVATSSFQRTELESQIRGDRPILTQIADPDVRRMVQVCCARHDLVRVFATKVERETWLLRLGRSRIECAIDRGAVASARNKAPICEVELELKSGQPARIYELAHRLNAVVPLWIETRSKAARGYDFVERAKLAAPKCGPIVLDPPMSVRECLAAIARPCVAHVLASANFACNSSDPEGIHQLRVAIRRMRAAFSIFHGAMPESYRPRLEVKLQTFARKLGAARDWDVLVEETIPSMPTELRKQRPTANLIRIAQARRAEGDRSVHVSLRDRQYTEVLLQLASWADSQFGSNGSLPQEGKWKTDVLAGPAPSFAAQAMQTFHDKARKLGERVREIDPPEIHRLRIRIKKLRYATDFFSGLWPNPRTARYLSTLKGLQEALGEFHDTIVADELISHFPASEADIKLSAAPVNRWLTKHQQDLRRMVIKLWREFAKQRPFWDGA